MTDQALVVGRYAPSPTGNLHLGNLRTALLAWLSARLQGGRFIVRMEDIDQPRVVKGSADQILRDLEWLGLDWDGPVVYQSKRHDLYQNALDTLSKSGSVYPCFCSRKDIRVAIQGFDAPLNNNVYPGTCRLLSDEMVHLRRKNKVPSIRLRVPDGLERAIGDFVVKRADALFAYQLAVTVDDLDQGITEVLRGADLIDSTPKQQLLATMLSGSKRQIKYLHAPLMLDSVGEKMSKRDGSYSLKEWRAEGGSYRSLVGYLSQSIGLIDSVKSLDAEELLGLLKGSKLPNSLLF